MSHSVQMPALGESVTEGTVTRWLKNVGDAVAEDEPLLEVSTDKVDTEVPAPYAGIVEQILVQEDETVEIGAVLAVIGDGSGMGDAGATATAAQENSGSRADVDGHGSSDSTAAADVATPAESASPASAPSTSNPGVAAPATPESGASQAGTQVAMPAMGESVTEGTVTRWLKAVGDAVAEDEALVEISTDKVDAEVPSPVAGILVKILVEEDATVAVGAPIAVIGTAATSAPAPAPAPTPAPAPAPTTAPPAAAESSAPETATPPAASRVTPAAGTTAGGPTDGNGSYVTPVVRKLAADHGVDLARVSGSGVGGRIRREDVLAAARAGAPDAAQPPATPAAVAGQEASSSAAAAALVAPRSTAPDAVARPTEVARPQRATDLVGTVQPAPRIRQAIARSMMYAVTNSAQSTTIIEVDATRIAALRDSVQAAFRSREGSELTLVPFFVKAFVEAAKTNPIINASLSDDLTEITYHAAVHLGVAVETDRGQVSPVIHRADDLNVSGLARHLLDLVDRTRRGALAPDELSGATLTVVSAGAPGALIDTPIVVPPQAAALALGAVVKRPVVVTDRDGNDVIAVRSMATVALSHDQRFVDGSDAARYLAAVKRRIEDGGFHADLGL